jgi:hypothetical protein
MAFIKIFSAKLVFDTLNVIFLSNLILVVENLVTEIGK